MKKRLFISLLILSTVFSFGFITAQANKGLSTEELHNLQVQQDDAILAKDPSTLTPEEQKRLEEQEILEQRRKEQKPLLKIKER